MLATRLGSIGLSTDNKQQQNSDSMPHFGGKAIEQQQAGFQALGLLAVAHSAQTAAHAVPTISHENPNNLPASPIVMAPRSSHLPLPVGGMCV